MKMIFLKTYMTNTATMETRDMETTIQQNIQQKEVPAPSFTKMNLDTFTVPNVKNSSVINQIVEGTWKRNTLELTKNTALSVVNRFQEETYHVTWKLVLHNNNIGSSNHSLSILGDQDVDISIDKFVCYNGSEWSCKECGKTFKKRLGLRNHIEAQHIDTPGFPCDICGFVSKTRHALRGHKDYNHKSKKNERIMTDKIYDNFKAIEWQRINLQ